jgi:hypothetical protein
MPEGGRISGVVLAALAPHRRLDLREDAAHQIGGLGVDPNHQRQARLAPQTLGDAGIEQGALAKARASEDDD